MRVLYNPYEILESRHALIGGVRPGTQKKAQEPIMYDPSKAKLGVRKSGEKNVAPAGSLLKVWEGTLELAKDLHLQTSFFTR